LGKNFSNWSTRELAQHLAGRTGIHVHSTTVQRYLQRLGWVFRRPVRVVSSPDPRYKAKCRYLLTLKRRARRGEIHLYFADEFDIDLLPTIGGCWMPRGQQYKVHTSGQNQKHYGLGAVDYVTGQLLWCLSEHKNNAAFRVLLRLIEQAHQDDPIPVVIVVDNFIIHKAKKVREWLAERRGRMRLYFLPTYSPTLNPIERLWRHFRRRVTDNYFFATLVHLLDATRQFLQELVAQPETVLSIVNGNA
jgi:putative transposase